MDRSKLLARKRRLHKLDGELKLLFPHAELELKFSNPWELLVATVLAAQCTDKKVNMVTADLFRKYPNIDDYVHAAMTAAGIAEFERAIKPTGFYRVKTRHILEIAKILKERFGGKVPDTMQSLLQLPGVARKTATVVLSAGYGITAGITIDTHVIRFVQRYELSDFKDPVKIEQDLMQLVPEKEWTEFGRRVTLYGRYLAPARPYDTSKDPLLKIYPPAAKRFRA